ncbi:MAG: hypothetical protein K6U89_12220, partial [Chloroflexi bacterium]|nr:hypothetical protein [Chloroflexota bacterium]
DRRQPELQQDLAAVCYTTAREILIWFVGGPAELAFYAGRGPIMTDAHPYIEYYLSLPSGGTVPDLRWLPAATFLSANGRTSDVLLFGDPSFRELLHRFALPDFQELVLPGGATLDPATEAHLRTLVAGRRVWFVPHPANPREETVIALLDGLKRRSEDRTHGLVRLLRWDDP